MLVTFGGIILVFLLIQLIGAGLILGYKSKVKEAVEKGIFEGTKLYNQSTPSGDMNKVLDDLQLHFKCCGSHGAADYELAWNDTIPRLPKNEYPGSCCGKKIINETTESLCTKNEMKNSTIGHQNGCVSQLEDQIRGSLGALGGIAIAIAFIQLIGVVFACCLGRSIRKEYEVV